MSRFVRKPVFRVSARLYSIKIWLEAINFGFRKTCRQIKGVDQLCGKTAQLISAIVLAYAKAGFLITRLTFLNSDVLQRRIFFSSLFCSKHRIMGTHIRNNPLHCSQLLSELLVFELSFVNIGLCLFACAMKVLIQFEMQNI